MNMCMKCWAPRWAHEASCGACGRYTSARTLLRVTDAAVEETVMVLPANTCNGDCIRAAIALVRSGTPIEDVARGAHCTACATIAARMVKERPDLRSFLARLGFVDADGGAS